MISVHSITSTVDPMTHAVALDMISYEKIIKQLTIKLKGHTKNKDSRHGMIDTSLTYN